MNAAIPAYAPVWAQLDCFVSFRVPSWQCVERWRSLQEAKLAEALRADPSLLGLGWFGPQIWGSCLGGSGRS